MKPRETAECFDIWVLEERHGGRVVIEPGPLLEVQRNRQNNRVEYESYNTTIVDLREGFSLHAS